MDLFEERYERDERREADVQTGYTLVEILGVTALVVLVVLMTQGMIRNYKRFAVEETCVQRLHELARHQHTFRHLNDPTVNPEGTYGTFFDLQNAGLVSEIYEQSDEKRHTVNAYVPRYELNFMRSLEDDDLEPDAYHYMIQAVPLYNSLGLKTFYMREDGEVYWFYHPLWIEIR